MNEGERQRIVDSVAAVTREGVGHVSTAQLDAGWERLESTLSGRQRPSVRIVAAPSRWWLRGFAVATVAAVAFLAHWLVPERGEPVLQYVVEGATVGPSDVITAGAVPGTLRFSDSSEVALAPAAVVSVASLDAHGSRIVLADGALDVRVRHRSGTSWRFDAGPFTVKVRGTEFYMAFDAAHRTLAVRMRSGVVEVHGPSKDRLVTLRAGESIELSAPASHALEPAPSPAAVSAGEPPDSVGEQAGVVRERAERAPALRDARERGATVRRRPDTTEPAPPLATAGTSQWGRLIARGEFEAIVREAEGRGIDVALAGASAADLSYIADAARYTKRNDLARRALLDLRARFPGTTRSSDAAFFLGRLAERPGASAAAIEWYDSYLRESPQGPYAGEALGRQIALLVRTDPARARAAATAYLERFPTGTQAELAKSLVESSP